MSPSSHSSSQMQRPRAILFDHDGVLVASEPLHWDAWGKLLVEMGLTYQQSEVQALVGKTAPQIIEALLKKHRPDTQPGDYDLDALARRKNEFYVQAIPSLLKPYPGVLEGLRWMRSEGIAAAVVSNARRRELTTALDAVGITPLLDAIVSREDAGTAKPDPGPYLFAAASLGVDPTHCIAVEDSPPGLEAALVAKIPSAAVLTNFKPEALSAPVPGRPDLRPVWLGPSMEEFFRWIQSLPAAAEPAIRSPT